jgi:splicing factor U2AF subunit
MRDRSRSRSASPAPARYDPKKERRRPTWFDIQPVGGAPPPVDSLPGAIQVVTNALAGSSAAAGASNQQATRHARRIYIGGLPPHALEDQIATFFSNALAAVGGTTAGPGPCVINVYINQEKKFAFAELRTVEETSNAMALDGVMFEGVAVRVRRPADYNAAAAAQLGPSDPNPNLNLAAIALDKPKPKAGPGADAAGPQGSAFQEDPNRLFVGGLPYYLSEDECKELLGTFGAIKYFYLIRDRATGSSKGYAFIIYEDPGVIEAAIAGLNGMKLGDRSISVRRADPQKTARPVSVTNAEDGTQRAMFTAVKPKVVRLINAVTVEELADDDDYEDILEDMREEASRFGKVDAVHVPRPSGGANSEDPPGVGLVLIEFADSESAMNARNALHNRKFDNRTVEATLMTQEDYESKNWR